MPKRSESSSPKANAVSVTPTVYNRFIDGLEFVDIRLKEAEINAPELPAPKVFARIEVSEASYRYVGDSDLRVSQKVAFYGAETQDGEPRVSVIATFELAYATSERMNDEIFIEFKSRNVPINTWPYFRELVHTALARAGWPIFLLPAYKTGETVFSPIPHFSGGVTAKRARKSSK